MRLGTDKCDPELCIVPRIYIQFLENPREVQGITRNDMDYRRFEIAHQLNLPFTVACPCRYDERPHLFGGIMKTQTSREKSIRHHVLEDISFSHARHIYTPGKDIRP